MTDSPEAPAKRLDSWKAISDYLGRDERTVRRWEKELGLPVRRVPGGRGRSVFAYVTEVDAWLQTAPPGQATPTAAPSDQLAMPIASEPPAERLERPAWPRTRVLSFAAVTVLVLSVVAWRGLASGSAVAGVRVTAHAVVATDQSGAAVWSYSLPPDELASPPLGVPAMLPADTRSAGLYAIAGGRIRQRDSMQLGGRIFWLTAGGRLRGDVSLDDQLRFDGQRYGAPWDVIDGRIDGHGPDNRLAIVAHQDTWWPGLVTTFANGLTRGGTFVNAGWVEAVRWVAADRLVASGISNARDGGMVMLLDANALDGQSPEPAGSGFHCDSCGAGSPVRYVVLPRSEINRLSGASVNRARLDLTADRVVVRTEEAAESDGAVVDALFEFTASLDLVKASFGDRYWDVHRALEAQGKIHHSREQCPDRDGPREIQMWEPSTGWRTVRVIRN